MTQHAEPDIDWLRHFIGVRRWQRGKADPSHEYTIRAWLPDGEQDFERATTIIRELGEPARFWSKTYVYLQIDGMKYWTMGEEVSVTTVLNRAET